MRKHIYWTIGLFLAWLVFFGYGLWVHELMAGSRELYGYDYAVSFMKLRSFDFMIYTGIRHPGFGLLLSPVILFAANIAQASVFGSEVFVLAIVAMLAVANLWLVWRIGGWIAAVLFTTFGFFWINAACPDSFPFAMLTLLLMMWRVHAKGFVDEVRHDHAEGTLDLLLWVALFVLATSVTVTNGLKVIVVYLITHRLSRRQWAWMVAGGLALLAVVAAFFWIRMLVWNATYSQLGFQKSVWNSVMLNLRWTDNGLSWPARVRAVIDGFLVVPILPRWTISNAVKPVLPSVFGYAWAAVVYGWATISLWRGWRDRVVQACVAAFAVDVFIHVICGWGLNEAWIFAPHWFWLMPICIGRGFRK